MNETRRNFLKKVGFAAVGVGGGFPLLAAAHRALEVSTGAVTGAVTPSGSQKTQWCMVVDIQKCLNDDVRSACSQACHSAHNVPQISDAEEDVKWMWTENYEDAFPDQANRCAEDYPYASDPMKGEPVLVLCNHCTDPACTKVCPTVATWRREEDGIVMMDMHRCIGCRYCMAACPYGARSFNWSDPRKKDSDGNFVFFEGDELPSKFPARTKGVVEKCNFCAERLREGLKPACVESANQVDGGEGALTFGNLADPDDDVSKLLRKEHTIVRKLSAGTGPNVFYILPNEIEDSSEA